MIQHKLVQSEHILHKVHGSGILGRFNTWLAIKVTNAVGSMFCAYIFILIALISLPQALNAFLSGDTVTGVSWLSQSMIQLVCLPVILVGTRVLTAAQDAQTEADHLTLSALHELNITQLEILELLKAR